MPPEKIVFLIPYGAKEYLEFCKAASQYLPRALPMYPGWISGAGTLRTVLHFDSDWTPYIQSLDVRGFKVDKGKPLVAPLRVALQPVAKRLGVVWIGPPEIPVRKFLAKRDLIMVIPLLLIIAFFLSSLVLQIFLR